ncbi:protein Niban [Perca flavescens]|uniref:protein Niban n=1 Tax=Perca flavescens TaxID=8167 RepID=UPI00106EDDE2|nr:protein Niban-like [Perca flavescens]
MGASSSGLLDEAKISNIKGLVDSAFQSFSVFYRQQYSAAYIGHLHQEVEPKKEGRGLLLTPGPQYAREEVLYQGSVKFSCWDEQGKKCRERYAVLKGVYKVEIHENMETFSRGCSAKLVLQPAGCSVFTTEEESRAHLEKTCAGILNGAKEDSSSLVSSPDVPAVYLHRPFTGYTCFLFQQEEERDHFLSALKTCIRHGNLDPWCDPSYESQAYVRALRLYQQDKGCYESWEKLLGTEEQVLASQVMEEVLSWLQSQLQSRVKGKKTERIRQWLATVQATYTLVLVQLTASLEALREECRQTASANQALIRSNLDQIMSSHCFLEEKVKACLCEEAEKVCSESVAPYISSILEVLTENISVGIQGMQHTLHTQMDSAFTHTIGGTEETKMALSTLRSISLDQCYRQVENLAGQLEDLKQRFGLSSTQRLVHSAHLEMEKLLNSAVYTLELFLQASARLQPSQIPVKMERAKERVLKQLDYDSRVVQRRLYQEALLEITLPALTRKMDNKWKSELQQFEQYIFSDYSSFILVHNIYDDVLRNILSKEIETAVQDVASRKSNSLLLDTADMAISQYSLLGQTPPRTAPGSPAVVTRDSSSAAAPPGDGEEPGPVSADVPAQCAQSDQSATPERSATPDLSTAERGTEDTTSVQHPGAPSSHPPCTGNKISLGSLSEAIGCNSAALSVTQTTAQHGLDRAVYLTGEIKDNWEMERVKEERNKEAAEEKEIDKIRDSIKDGKEEIQAGEGKEEEVEEVRDEGVAQSGGEPVGEACQSSDSPAESATALTAEQRASEERVDDGEKDSELETEKSQGEEEEEEQADQAEREGKKEKEEVLQSPQPMGSQPESAADLPLDSVAIIRDLVVEITEVETVISPCSDSSHTP